MDERKAFWLTAAEQYFKDCRGTASPVRVSEFASRMERQLRHSDRWFASTFSPLGGFLTIGE